MEVSAKELRGKPGKIIEQAARGIEIIITLRGKKAARLIPYKNNKEQNIDRDEIFGMWEKHNQNISIDEQVRELRKRRAF